MSGAILLVGATGDVGKLALAPRSNKTGPGSQRRGARKH